MNRKLVLIFLILLLGGYSFWNIYFDWRPTLVLDEGRYTIYSTASASVVREAHRALENQYSAYKTLLKDFALRPHEDYRLKVKLYASRAEFRRYTFAPPWAEGFYRYPFCNQYYSTSGPNRLHWMLHEAVHQLNAEVANLKLERWLNEGLATYFSTSLQTPEGPRLGDIDPHTYPVWWLDLIARSGELKQDIAAGNVVPLKQIISDRGGPNINEKFNLYYLHWWTLVHFLLEGREGRYRSAALELLHEGGGPAAFTARIGPIKQIQSEWYEHVLMLKSRYGQKQQPRTATP